MGLLDLSIIQVQVIYNHILIICCVDVLTTGLQPTTYTLNAHEMQAVTIPLERQNI